MGEFQIDSSGESEFRRSGWVPFLILSQDLPPYHICLIPKKKKKEWWKTGAIGIGIGQK